MGVRRTAARGGSHDAGQPRCVRQVADRSPGVARRLEARHRRRVVRAQDSGPGAARPGGRGRTGRPGRRRGDRAPRPPNWVCRTSSPTRAARRWRRVRRRWATRPGGSSCTGAPTTISSTACSSAPRASCGRRRGHPRHDHARLAPAGPQPRLAAVRAGAGDRAVHVRSACSAGSCTSGSRPPRRQGGRRGDARRDPVTGVDDPALSRAASSTTCARPEPRAAVETFLDIYSRPSLSWDDIATLRSRTTLPILLKGVLHPDDARRALDARGGRHRGVEPRWAAGGRQRVVAGRARGHRARRGRQADAAPRQRNPHAEQTSSRPSRSVRTR